MIYSSLISQLLSITLLLWLISKLFMNYAKDVAYYSYVSGFVCSLYLIVQNFIVLRQSRSYDGGHNPMFYTLEHNSKRQMDYFHLDNCIFLICYCISILLTFLICFLSLVFPFNISPLSFLFFFLFLLPFFNYHCEFIF